MTSGDDRAATGLNLQEVELAFSAAVDPCFRAELYLAIPNAEGIEVEEGFVTTTSLPWSFQLRAGMLRAAFGRQNTQHLHAQDFTRRPQWNALLLGPDGLRAPAVELSWLVPLPFYLLISGEMLSVAPVPVVDDPTAVQTFGGGKRTDFTWLANLKTFVPFTDNTSALLGLSFATGLTSQQIDFVAPLLVEPDLDGLRSRLYGADLYLKWKPPNVSATFMSLAWTTEFVLREIPSLDHRIEGALSSQLVWQV